ncbi:MAG TPA: hypothetical protein VM364_18610 [Vicinamibacterales bacterium]|nr:hypothetical protein [Vicinamibacterales bacterium]
MKKNQKPAESKQVKPANTKPVAVAEPPDLDDYAREVGREPGTAEPIAPTADAPVLTKELIDALRSADSVDAGLKLLQPDANRPKAKTDAVYELNASCAEPLPQKRGACLKVVTVAVRLNRPFKVSDIIEALPEVKSAPYWTRKLAKTGHLVERA